MLAEPAPEAVLQELSHDLMSPYCPGRTIASCPSGLARKLEDRILAEAKAGKTREEIESELVAEFGRDIRGYEAPGGVIWGTSAAALVAIVLLLVAGRRWVRRSRVAPAEATNRPGASLSEHDRERLEDALDEEEGF